jgi:hypothetical protein
MDQRKIWSGTERLIRPSTISPKWPCPSIWFTPTMTRLRQMRYVLQILFSIDYITANFDFIIFRNGLISFLNRTWLGWSRDWVTWKPLFGWTVLRSVTEILYGHLAWLNWFTFRLSICYRHLSPTRNPFRWSRMRITSFWESLDCELLVTSRIRQSHLNFPPYLLLLLHTRIKFYQI